MSIKSNKKLEEIIEKNNIHIDKSAELMDEVGLTMLGMKKPANFRDNIKKRLGISKEKANKITKDVDEKIFAPIKNSLMETHSEPEGKEENLLPNEKTSSEEVPLPNGSRTPSNRSRESLLREIENPQPTDMTFKKDTSVEKVEKLGELKETPAQEKEESLRQKDSVKKPNFNYEEKEEKQFVEKTEKKDVLDRNLTQESEENKDDSKKIDVYKDKDPYLEPID